MDATGDMEERQASGDTIVASGRQIFLADEDIELDGIDVSKWNKRNGLWLVPEEHRLEVL